MILQPVLKTGKHALLLPVRPAATAHQAVTRAGLALSALADSVRAQVPVTARCQRLPASCLQYSAALLPVDLPRAVSMYVRLLLCCVCVCAAGRGSAAELPAAGDGAVAAAGA